MGRTMTETADHSRAELIKQAQAAMQAGHFHAAAAIAADMLTSDPADQDALYMSAVAARYLGQFQTAADRLHLQVVLCGFFSYQMQVFF